MSEKDLNIEYICEKTLLNKDDELVPIILSLIQESYKAGLCQTEFDNTMNLIEENQELKKQLEVGNKQYCDLVEEKEILQEQLSIKTLQLEELKSSKRDYTQENILEMKMFKLQTQQKAFIKFLEDEIKKEKEDLEHLCDLYKIPQKNNSTYKFVYSYINKIEKILQKYKEITQTKIDKSV